MKISHILKESMEDESTFEELSRVKTLLVMAREFMNKKQYQQYVNQYESITDEEDAPDELWDAQIEALDELGDQLENMAKQYYGKDFDYIYSKSEQLG